MRKITVQTQLEKEPIVVAIPDDATIRVTRNNPSSIFIALGTDDNEDAPKAVAVFNAVVYWYEQEHVGPAAK